MTGIRICRNELAADEGGAVRARATEELETIDCGLVFRSIGYRAECRWRTCPSTSARGVITNDRGRVTEDGAPLPGEYVTGWIKRGPTGIIGTNKRDAQETVDVLLEDLDAGRLPSPRDTDREALEELLAERRPDHVTYAGWEAIDRAERAAGEPHGRPAGQALQLRRAARGRPRAAGMP